jgi:hypothetical protein
VSTLASSPHDTAPPLGPPAWLIAATGLLAVGTLAMAVAETSLWMHYLIDAGESISLVGLAFILGAGIYLYAKGRLLASLPFALPWLLFPVITQGDQIIDNLSIGWMRLISHVLLGALFGFPVAVFVLAFRYMLGPKADGRPRRLPGWAAIVPGLRQMSDGRFREGGATLATLLLVLEMWVAVRFLGLLMVTTLIVMIWAVLAYGFAGPTATAANGGDRRSERFALVALLLGVMVSVGLFVGFKNRPGAYQGSPSYFMDPAQQDAGFRLDRVAVPGRPPVLPPNADAVRAALTTYGRAFERLLAGYYVLDRNYNYHFHNELFMRSTPLLPEYRKAGLARVAEAEALRREADRLAVSARPALPEDDPLGALLDDVAAYAEYTFQRAPVLEGMSEGFEMTRAGLQHATHLYEGEGKVLGVRLDEILEKHRQVLDAAVVQPVTGEFAAISKSVHDAYANRIVGF